MRYYAIRDRVLTSLAEYQNRKIPRPSPIMSKDSGAYFGKKISMGEKEALRKSKMDINGRMFWIIDLNMK